MKQGLFVFLLLVCIAFCENPDKEIHFYCRKCGAHIANFSSLLDVSSEKAESQGEIGNLEADVHIHYDQFGIYKEWSNKRLMYFKNATDAALVSPEKHSSSYFKYHSYSPVSCALCRTQIGFFLEEVDEDEFEFDDPEDYASYSQEDIADLLAVEQDRIDDLLDDVFKAIPSPVRSIGYWSYRYNHKQQIEQFHRKVPGANDVELNWSLGSFDKNGGIYGIDMNANPPMPYYAYKYTNGQHCDEIKAPRETEVRFEPCSELHMASLQSIKEVSICKYVMHFCIPSLMKKESARKGFYAVSPDSVIASNDKSFIELMEKDHFDQSFASFV